MSRYYEGQPIDAASHIFATRLAWRLVGIVSGVLREEEMGFAATSFYKAIVEDLKTYERESHADVHRPDLDVRADGGLSP